MVENGTNHDDPKSVEVIFDGSTLLSQSSPTPSVDSPSVVSSPSFPSNCFPLTHQVAGHFFGKGKTKLGLLQTNDGLVLKPVQSPPRGEREHNFFKRIFTDDISILNKDEIDLRSLLPTYRGFVIHDDINYIKMDDLAYGINFPAVIDFKMGRVTHDPEASNEKIVRQKSKYPPVEKIGFQLIGMRVFNSVEKTFSHYDKIFGRALAEEDLVHGLALFYQFHQTPQIQAIKETLKKFDEIQSWFERQTTYQFFSSSLIVVYEGDLEDMLHSETNNNNNSHGDHNLSITNTTTDVDKRNSSSNCSTTNQVRIIMADFAHVFPAEENCRDDNYLFGLIRLIEHLKILLKPDYVFKDVRV